MGTFGKSFSREIGKNTGKWASNKLFGDGHATPKKHIHAGSVSVRVQKANIELEKAKLQQEHDKKMAEEQMKYEEKIALENKLETISSSEIPNDSDSITNMISNLQSTASSSLEKSEFKAFRSELDEKNSPIYNSCISKIEDCIHKLNSIGDSSNRDYYQKKLDNLKLDYDKTIASYKSKTKMTIIKWSAGIIIFILIYAILLGGSF